MVGNNFFPSFSFLEISDDFSYLKFGLQIAKMISCFLQHGGLGTISELKLIFILVLIFAVDAQPLVYWTTSTNCSMTFETGSTNTNNNQMQLKNCTRKLCLRNLINGNCANLQQFELDNQKCIRQCCGSLVFDFVRCEQYNKEKLQRQSSSDRKLVIALLASLLGVLVAVIIFAISYLNCCKNYQHSSSKSSKQDQIHWKDCKFLLDKQCHSCKQSAAFVAISCGTLYHLKCLNNNQNWTCSHCDKKIKKVKVFCPVCLQKSIVIQTTSFDDLDRKVVEMYGLHPDKCLQQMTQQMDTERKFTESTKQ